MAAPMVWDEQQAYEELLYWDRLIQEGHRLLPHDFDRYSRGSTLGVHMLVDNGQNDRQGSNTVWFIIARRWEMQLCHVLLSPKGCFISIFYRYEELRYWYDCLFYEEELRQYHDYIAAIEEIESRHYHEVGFFLPFNPLFIIVPLLFFLSFLVIYSINGDSHIYVYDSLI